MKGFIKRYSLGIILFCIVVLAGAIRFYQIDTMPVSLYWDEAAIGYNAYSIAQTGKDEYGIPHPFLFKSFNDYKASGYIYLTVIPVSVFGLNEFSIRFWSAFLGTVTVFLSFLFVRSLFHLLDTDKKSVTIALITALLLAISPWHIQFSRVGFEANVALFLIVFASWLLIKNIPHIGKSFIISTICFALSFYFYRSVYVFTPLFLLGSIVIFRSDFIRQRKNKYLLLGILTFFLLFLPFLPSMLSSQGMIRAKQTSVFTVLFEDLMQASIKRQELGDPQWAQIVFNRRVIYVEQIVKNYFSHFTPKFLFFEGDSNARHRTIGFGTLYIWEAPFLLIGIFMLFTLSKKVRNFILLWILVAPLAASVALPAPHALRSLNMLPMPQLLVAMGLVYAYYWVRPKIRPFFLLIICIVVFTSFISYANSYKMTLYVLGKEWAYGYKQLATYVFKNEDAYDKIIVSGHYWQPYVYFLFYKQYDPGKFQQYGNKMQFDKYLFGGTNWDQGKELDSINLRKFSGTDNVLVALSPKEYEGQKKHIKKLKVISDYNNQVIFIIGKLQ